MFCVFTGINGCVSAIKLFHTVWTLAYTVPQVGLYNARYFLLFMVHMAFACTSVALLGFKTMLRTFDFRSSVSTTYYILHSYCDCADLLALHQWPYFTPRPFSLILWILCVAMGFALSVMAIWQVRPRS